MSDKTVSLKTTDEDADLIYKIALKAMKKSIGGDIRTTVQALTIVHANGNPLRLKELLDCNTFDFAHDIAGILENLDFTTGEFNNFFEPRFTDYQKIKKMKSEDN